MNRRLLSIVAMAGAAAAAQAQSTNLGFAQRAETLSDASGRTSSLAQGAQDFTVNVHGFTQFRFNWNSRDDQGLDANNNDQTIGFHNARTKLKFNGNIANENWGYQVQFKLEDPGSASGTAILDDAYGTYKMGDGWKLTFGQFKLPLFREENMGDDMQLFANRSVVNSFFSQSRSQGIMASYEGDSIRFAGAFSDGLVTRNTDFTDTTREADIALTGRIDYKFAGDWKQAKDFTSFQNSPFFGAVGGAAHWQTGGDTVGTADMDMYDLTVDVQLEGNGWNAFAAVCYQNTDPATGNNLTDWSFQVQGGVFVAADWELIGGWSILMPDSDRAPADENFNTLQIGVNHYVVPESHVIKITVDLSYFVDQQSTTAIALPSTVTGLLASGQDTQWNLRGQVQLTF